MNSFFRLIIPLFLFTVGINTVSYTKEFDVLLLHSSEQEYYWTESIIGGIEKNLNDRFSGVNLHTLLLDYNEVTKKFEQNFNFDFNKNYLGNVKYDLIISADDISLKFLIKHRDKYFIDIPIVFCGVVNYDDSLIQGQNNITGIYESINLDDYFKLIVKLHPSVENIIVILDSTPVGSANEKLINKIIPLYNEHQFFLYENLFISGVSEEKFPENSLILLLGSLRNNAGNFIDLKNSVRYLSNKLDIPIYAISQNAINRGVIASRSPRMHSLGVDIAEIAKQILKGRSISKIPVQKGKNQKLLFDYQQLTRFDVNVSELPPDVTLLNKSSTFYDLYSSYIWTAILVFMVLIIIIILLLINIRKRKKAEHALRENERKYRELTDFLPQIVFEIDLTGNLLFANSIAFEIFRFNKEDSYRGLSVLDYIAPQDKERARVNIMRSLKNENFSEEYTALRTDGTTFPIIIHSSPVIKDNKLVGLRGIIVDITERKRIEETIKESEEKYRTLIENLNEGLIIADLEENIVFSNPSANKIFGVQKGTLVGRSLKEFTDKNQFQIIRNYTKERKKGNKAAYEIEIVRIDGSKRNLYFNVEPYRNKSDDIVGGFGVFSDITDSKKAEERLRILSRAVYQSPNSFIITDICGNIEYVNPKFIETTYYTLEELTGTNLKNLGYAIENPEKFEVLWRTIISGNEWRGELLNSSKKGEVFWEQVSVSPVMNDEGETVHFIIVSEDITERKKTETMLIQAKEEAEKSNKLKTEFLAQMSHEIRTPINSILSFTSLLREELEQKVPEELRSSFKIIENGGRRLIRTIDLLLNMSQIQTGNFELNPVPTDLEKDILDSIIPDFLTAIKDKNLEFEFIRNNINEQIMVDQYTVQQIFTNLIDNAVKYTNNGKIEVEIYKNDHKSLCIDVRDTGIGIADSYMPYLFTSFSQEEMGYSRRFDGNGLGLALTKKYAEVNNADIIVKSKKGTGSTFTVAFDKTVKR